MIPGGSGFLGAGMSVTDPGKLTEYLTYAHPWELDTLAKQGDPSIQQAVAVEQQRRAAGGRQQSQYDSMSPQDIAGYQVGNPSPGDALRRPHSIPNYQIAADAWLSHKPPPPQQMAPMPQIQPQGQTMASSQQMGQGAGRLAMGAYNRFVNPQQQGGQPGGGQAGLLSQFFGRGQAGAQAPAAGILSSGAQSGPQILGSQMPNLMASAAPAASSMASSAAPAAAQIASSGSWADLLPFLQWFS